MAATTREKEGLRGAEGTRADRLLSRKADFMELPTGTENPGGEEEIQRGRPHRYEVDALGAEEVATAPSREQRGPGGGNDSVRPPAQPHEELGAGLGECFHPNLLSARKGEENNAGPPREQLG